MQLKLINAHNLLVKKTNIIRLAIMDSSNINDNQAIMLAKTLKNNIVLRSLTVNKSGIGDIGFQALLSSLPNSLSQLIINNNQINATSLLFLLDFIKDRPTLKHIYLEENMIRFNSSAEINALEFMEKIQKITNTNHYAINLGINERVSTFDR